MARRKRTATGEVSNRFINIRLSPSEYQYVKEVAGPLSLSEYFRRAGLGQSVPQRRKPQPLPQVNRELLVEMGKMSNALHQISKTCHLALKRGQNYQVDIAVLQELRMQLKVLSWAIAGINPNEDVPDDEAEAP
jgi:hypothetical protein